MRNLQILLGLIFIISGRLYAQSSTYQEVVYLKNGGIIKGVIIEQEPNEKLKIETKDGNVLVYKYEEIDRISKEQIDRDNRPTTRQKKFVASESDSINKSSLIKFNRFSLHFAIGYAIAVAPQFLYSTNNLGVAEGIYGSFGVGKNVGLRLNYHLNNNCSIDLGVNYLNGNRIYANSSSNNYNSELAASASILNLNPAFSISHSFKSIKFNLRSGILIGFLPRINEYSIQNYWNLNLTVEQTTRFYSGFPFGFSSLIGTSIPINRWLSCNAEINLNTQNWSPQKSRITELYANGIDKLNELDNTETIYVDSYEQGGFENNALKRYFPLSNLSINLGISINM